MATVQKGDIVNMALRKATIASASVAFLPETESVMEALEDLESMVAAWKSDNLDIGYIFSEDNRPNPADDSGVELEYKLAVSLQLARQVLIDNNRSVPPELNLQANKLFDTLRSSFYKTVSLKQRNDMPTGDGNKPFFAADRFYFDGTSK